MINKEKNMQNLCFLVILIFITTIIFFICYGTVDLSEPIHYSGDSLFAYTEIKSILDYGWYMNNPSLGCGTYNLYQFSTGDLGVFIIIKILVCFSDNIFFIYNLYFFLTFILVSVAAYSVLVRCRMDKMCSVILAVLYAYLPYHQLRIGHALWLTGYYVVPLFFIEALELVKNREKAISINWFLHHWFGVCILCLFNVYYVFFGCILLGIAFMINLINNPKNKNNYLKMLLLGGSALIGVILNFAISLWHIVFGNLNVSSSALQDRTPAMAETFSFKIIQLFLPRIDHRIESLREISQGYLGTTVSHSEGMYTSLGMVLSIGFLILIFMCLKKKKGEDIETVVWFNLAMVLIGIVGGIGCMIAYCFPLIRAYGRVSVYNAFFSVYILDKLLTEKVVYRLKCKGKVCLCFLILVIGIYDQTITYERSEQDNAILEKNIDKAFVEKVVQVNEGKGRIYQMPNEDFPYGTFEYLKAYLFSDKEMYWSGGIPKGNKKEAWAKMIEGLTPAEMLDQLSIEGYDGIWISKGAYLSYNTEEELETLLKDFKSVLGEPLESGFGNYLYFDFGEENFSIDGIRQIYSAMGKGFSWEQKDSNGLIYNWCEQDGEVFLFNENQDEQDVYISFQIGTLGEKEGQAKIYINQEEYFSIDIGKERNIEMEIVCPKGKSIFMIKTDIGSENNPVGIRKSSFYIKNLQIYLNR